jgi:hypothetical protein
MSVTQGQYDEILRNRRVYFGTPDGRIVLRRWLECLGFLRDREDWVVDGVEGDKVQLALIVQAFCLLEQLGVLIPENFDRLIDAMAGLPMPMPMPEPTSTVQERNENGET